ncbi:MAG TPA: CPBP family intramembrane glutamic endopeptidase, partial [Bryobacteraceae bacterium]|nr:CPBP family intramembrane glutamic endopeptidase [Bryobacteraceae bacterium]
MVGTGGRAHVSKLGHAEPVLKFLVLTFFLSYSVGFGNLMMRSSIAAATSSDLAAQYLSRIGVVYAPAFSALLIAWKSEGRHGVRDLLRRMHPNGRWRWVPALVVAGVACSAAAALLCGVDPAHFKAATRAWPLFVAHLLLQFVFVGCGEELGWRGWLLPQLLTRYRPGVATSLVAGIWGFWHAPVLLTEVRLAVLFLFGVFGLSFLFTALWARVHGNIFVLAAAHASVNAPLAFFEERSVSAAMPSLHLQSTWETAFAIYGALGLATLVWKRRWYYG